MAWFGGESSGSTGVETQRPDVDVPDNVADLVCRYCRKENAELRCSRCGAPYCCQECQRADWKLHKVHCSNAAIPKPSSASAPQHRTVSSSSTNQAEHEPRNAPVPDLLREVGGTRLTGWREFFADKNILKAREEKVKFCECFALATLQALQALPSLLKYLPSDFRLQPVRGRCVVWILGARDGIEKRQIVTGGWEELFNALDVGWDVALIGPEMQKDDKVSSRHGRRIFTFNCTSHEAQLPPFLQDPTFICAFNTGLGAAATPHMRPWLPTLQQLLTLRKPLLLTCFGQHEARMETSIFRATGAVCCPHQTGSFGYVLEKHKPLSVCNHMFTWMLGSSLPDNVLSSRAMPHVDGQLRSVELMNFLAEIKYHLRILQDPDRCAHSGWSSMTAGGGLGMAKLKDALEMDDDDRGGIQTIVRCSMGTIACACVNPVAAAVFLHLGGEAVLTQFQDWAQVARWTHHDWMRAEVQSSLATVKANLSCQRARDLASDPSTSGDEAEEPLTCVVRVTSTSVHLRAYPDNTASVVAKARAGQDLSARSRRGLWLRTTLGETEGWLLCYEGGTTPGYMFSWDVAPL